MSVCHRVCHRVCHGLPNAELYYMFYLIKLAKETRGNVLEMEEIERER
jgi:hypothetical protein